MPVQWQLAARPAKVEGTVEDAVAAVEEVDENNGRHITTMSRSWSIMTLMWARWKMLGGM